MSAVGALLREVRESQGKSREDLVRAVWDATGKKLSGGAIENIEKGKTSNPGVLTLDLIARGLGYDGYVAMMLGRADSAIPASDTPDLQPFAAA